MQKFEIKHRYNNSILWSGSTESLKDAVELAVKAKVNLSYANLRNAYLYNVDLTNANLRNANLRNANLSDANLTNVDLSYAYLRNAYLYNANLTNVDLSDANLRNAYLYNVDLTNANLRNANLSDANLSDADLTNANLRNANLTNVDLRNANLTNVDLSYANLRKIKKDFLSIITLVPDEVIGLKNALIDGKVDGMIYEGKCACLIGTIAKLKHCDYEEIPNLVPNSFRPAERFFFAIKKGDTLETNQVSKIVVEWIDEFLKNSQ